MSTAVVVGNPKAGSRTLASAQRVVRELTGAEPDLVVDLAELGPALLDWSSDEVTALVEQLGAADLVVVASPTYKGTFTGLLKLFLDRFAAGTGPALDSPARDRKLSGDAAGRHPRSRADRPRPGRGH